MLNTTVLHPAYKLEYFKWMRWPENWIKQARSIVEGEFQRTYMDLEVELTGHLEGTTNVRHSLFLDITNVHFH